MNNISEDATFSGIDHFAVCVILGFWQQHIKLT